MFTGIIEDVGRIAAVQELGGGRRFTVEASFAPQLRVDQSVAINGACQTVVAVSETAFEVVAIEETLRKTTFGAFAAGTPVNLERALQPTGRLDGHFVQGHVDATGEVVGVEAEATSWRYRVRFDARFAPYLIPVGSITLDGISLTVARLEDEVLTVAIIPHTYEHTTVRTWRPGTRVNLEFDLIGKYVVGWLERRGEAPAASRISEAWLREQGF
ncbi:MAG: riboflavin synthase [Rhodothermales bacterium]|nr:riboflavin synthase [Rhodothermales bacterium]